MENDGETSSSDYALYHLSLPRVGPMEVTMQLNGVPVCMQVDTGAAVSIVNRKTFDNLKNGKDELVMQDNDLVLRTYTREVIRVRGKIEVEVQYGRRQVKLPLVVVEGSGPNLLGRDWLKKIRLDWYEICNISSQGFADILEKYNDVFDEGLGLVRGNKLRLYADEKEAPRFFKARPVPYALREKIEGELGRLVSEGVIEPVQFSEWAAPIVPIVKTDKSFRICGDYKLTVNRVAKGDTYPIPRIEDLFADLSGGKTFTKLDMSHAYFQLQLEEESKKYVTINTHQGLFRYNR